MGRGEREAGHRGGDSSKGCAVRGSNDKRRNLEDLEDDPYRELRDEEGNLPDPVNDEYIPRLATHWKISDDKKTFSFRINPDARWADGMPVTAEDIIATWNKVFGAEPANFLDVGGGATTEMVKNGFKILMSDPAVKVVFINIFGGILRCDTLAKGVTEAVREVKVDVPIVVRLEGTNVEEGRRILRESGLNFAVAAGMQEGAQKVMEALKR